MGLGSVNGCDHSGVGSCNRYRQGVLRVCNPTTRVSVPPDPSPFADNKLASRDHPVRGVVFVKSLSPGESPGRAFARICDGLLASSSRALRPRALSHDRTMKNQCGPCLLRISYFKTVMDPFSMSSPPKIAKKGHPGSRPWAGGPGLTPAARWALDPKIVGPCAASKIPQIFAPPT